MCPSLHSFVLCFGVKEIPLPFHKNHNTLPKGRCGEEKQFFTLWPNLQFFALFFLFAVRGLIRRNRVIEPRKYRVIWEFIFARTSRPLGLDNGPPGKRRV